MTGTEVVSTKTRRLRHLLLVALGQQEIGRRIHQAREEAGLTQSELADLLGLGHPQSISRYERGETEVPQKRLRRISEVTGKPLGFFIAENLGDPATEPAAEEVARQLADLEAGQARTAEALAEVRALLTELLRRGEEGPAARRTSRD